MGYNMEKNDYLLLSDEQYEYFDNNTCNLSIYNEIIFYMNKLLTAFVTNPCKTYNLIANLKSSDLDIFYNFFKNLDLKCVNKINFIIKNKSDNKTPLQLNSIKYITFLKMNIKLTTNILHILE